MSVVVDRKLSGDMELEMEGAAWDEGRIEEEKTVVSVHVCLMWL